LFGSFLLEETTNGGSSGSLRARVLQNSVWANEPPALATIEAEAERLDERLGLILEGLAGEGAVKISLERSLTNREFLRFGARFGELIPEHPSVLNYVDETYILNVRQELPETDDYQLQPFAENYITLHTELSHLPSVERPRYLIFMCEQAPAPDTGGQTLLVPMQKIYEQLTSEQRHILQHTRYGSSLIPDQPSDFSALSTFLYHQNNRPVFSFRDLGQQTLNWEYLDTAGLQVTRKDVNDAVRGLLNALYDPRHVYGVRWSPAVVWIIDNTFFFHGKTYCRIDTQRGRRWLKRLMVQESAREAAQD
jgi:alpha-ketoglutarate-dependent taurine dioxygenase